MKIDQQTIEGVFVEHATADVDSSAPPVIFIHGGTHGSWVWGNYLSHFAAAGWDAYAFSWFGHTGSRELPDDQFAGRSMVDTVEELEIVARHVGRVPVVVTHSMGTIVAQKYAEKHPVLAQVHLAPAICAEVGWSPDGQRDMEIDLGVPIERPPFELAWQRFLGGSSVEDARRYHALMTRESPTAIKEATTASVSVDRTRIGGPSLMVGAEHDVLVPAEAVRRSALHFGSDYLFLPGRSHNVVLEPGWRETADRVLSWLGHRAW